MKLPRDLGFLLVHLAPIAALWTGAKPLDWIVCGALYVGRMFFVTASYHRYFSHKSFRTSRAFQFVLAWMAQTSLQKGVLWWAANHRDHHLYSDTPRDPHSNKLYGFWYSHVGWILDEQFKRTRFERIADFAKFRELRWLNRWHIVPATTLMLAVFAIGLAVHDGTPLARLQAAFGTVLIGFFLSTVLLYHGTYSINSLMHMIGTRRYVTGDESRNSPVLALITLGEGWHNNHHFYQASTRQGFFWWEFDPTFYALKAMSWIGLVWDLKPVPRHVRAARTREEARAARRALDEARG